MKTRLLLCFIAIVLVGCVEKTSCKRGSADNAEAVVEKAHNDTSALSVAENIEKHPVATKIENSKFIFIEPQFQTIELVFNDANFNDFMSLEINGDSTVLAVAAAYTKKYNWSEFNHMLIAGNHAGGGNLYEGYKCLENTGAFIYANKHWVFINKDIDKRILELDGISDACAFAQTMLVHEGKVQQIPKTLPSKRYIRRALCDMHNKLVVVESKNVLTMEEFSNELVESGVYSAIYLDMGAMRYSVWREYSNDSIMTIHPVNNMTKFATNYLRFRI